MHADALAVSSKSRETFWRSLHALSFTRIVIAGVLLAYWGIEKGDEILRDGQELCRPTSAVYLGLALLFAALAFWYRRNFSFQLLAQILVDIAVISVLFVNSGGMKSGFAILYLFPLAGAAVLVTLELSLFFASLVTFVLLLDAVYRLIYQEADVRMTQAGMYGAAFLAAVFVFNRLAARLISQEALAVQRGNDLQIQVAINRLAIAQLDDGVMVLDAGGAILACNPAAEKMLGLSLEYEQAKCTIADIPTLQPLADAYASWKDKTDTGRAENKDSAIYLVIKRGDNATLLELENGLMQLVPTAHLEARFVSVQAEPLQEEFNVVFLQDVAKIEHQAQQLKLASMGRLTASIAHEVRNPLAAIAHASSLLAEELNEPGQERLLKIVIDNAARMNRMIGDILNLSRRAQSHEIVDLPALLKDIKTSFCEVHGLPESMLRIEAKKELRVRFDSLHLREVVINLLSNAIRYASGKPGSIRILVLRPAASRMELHVQDDGPSIKAEVRAHLFEPFYTTSSKGTGLGLYLARELCMSNGSRLDYEFHRDGSDASAPTTGRFVITFAPIDILQLQQHSRENLS